MTDKIEVHVPAQLRKWATRTLDAETQAERDLMDACKATGMGNSNRSSTIPLTNAALGVLIRQARNWLDSDNGNDVMASKTVLSRHELDYEPDDPREIRHEIKMPKSLAGHFPAPYKSGFNADKSMTGKVEEDISQMAWTNTGVSGRVRFEALGYLLRKMDRLKYHDHSAVSRAAKKFLDNYTEPHEKTQRLIAGYLEIDEDQAPEKDDDGMLTAAGFMEAIHGRGGFEEQPKRLVVIACGGKKSQKPGKIPADERYTGNYFTACRLAAEVMDGPTMVLSAKYGLIPLTEEIEDYDVKMGDKGSVRLGFVKKQVEELGMKNAKVTVLGGERYVKAARQIWPDAEAPLTGGIGQQLKQLAGIYEGEALDNDQDQEEPVRQWEKRRLSDFVSWGGERRFFYFGGLAKQPVNENGPLVGLKWSESESGTNHLKDPETGRVVAQVHSMSNVWAIPAEAPEGFVEYDDRGKPADELYWPEEYSRGEFRNIPNLPSRGRSNEPVIWYGGKAGVNAVQPKRWQKVRVVYIGEGKYDLSDFKTGESVKTCTLASQVFWARDNEHQDQEPATMPPGGYEVPANFLELAEEGNTDQAKAYWKRRCEEYRRTGK
ncbi:hypothetical protein U5640_16855 [Streptomyces sp. SS7]|uniref:DUF6884 domain-containing protein n=1 Tax=Streptomyces sp. SS7 TaxID=3108485 RepID=UPI0030EDC4B4